MSVDEWPYDDGDDIPESFRRYIDVERWWARRIIERDQSDQEFLAANNLDGDTSWIGSKPEEEGGES